MKKSAGILLFRRITGTIEVLLVHPGGPFWKKKDQGAWSIPKGEFEENEEVLSAAKREFYEETGQKVLGKFIELVPVRLRSGKWVYAWAVEGDMDVSDLRSNTFQLEWPPRSRKWIDVPEVDKAAWFDVPNALLQINPGQVELIQDLLTKV